MGPFLSDATVSSRPQVVQKPRFENQSRLLYCDFDSKCYRFLPDDVEL